jgi:2-polyprenyl-6-methoxyphenol hydroxylase-like FAD-dependent oxidoreductase
VPAYAGCSFVEFEFDDVDSRHPDVGRLVGQGTMSAYGENRALIAQRCGGGRVRVSAGFRVPRDWLVAAGVDLDDRAAVRAHLLAAFEGWDDRLLDLVRSADSGFVNRPIMTLPVGHSWEHVAGITLLGDAAHLMPPLGVGANLAMLDGADLADAVAAAANLDQVVRRWESAILGGAAGPARFSVDGLLSLISPNGVEGALRLYERIRAAH